MKNPQKGFAIPLIIAVFAILVIGVGAYYYSLNKKYGPGVYGGVPDNEIYKVSDSLEEVILLGDLIKSQNRFGLCINEVADMYKVKLGRVLSESTIAKAGQCISTVSKKRSEAEDGIAIVTYSQELPEACKSSRTLSDLLKVEVYTNTLQSKAEWLNGIKFMQTQINDIENSLKPVDCKAYAEFIGSNGTLR